MKKVFAATLLLVATVFLVWQMSTWFGATPKQQVAADIGPSLSTLTEEDKVYFTPWPVPTDFITLDNENVSDVLGIVSLDASGRARSVGLTLDQQVKIGPTVVGMLDRIVRGRDLDATLSELSSLGVMVDSDTRELLVPYFDKGRTMTILPKLSPGSFLLRKVYENGVELPEPFLGASSAVKSPTWPGMIPMGDDPVVGKYTVVEARISAWTPIVPGGEPELQYWGLRMAWDSQRARWLPMCLVKYTKLDKNVPKKVAVTPM
jgi:hypothetical protein